MKKRVFPILIALVLIVTSSCSVFNNQEEDTATENVTVTDHLGRKVTAKRVPERIVSGYYISTSALIALGLEEKIVGIEAKADKRPIYTLSAPQLLELPNVGTAKQFDLEGCIALNPDLVILPIKLKDQINTLEDMGITVLGVNPESQELLNEMITIIAKLTDAKDYLDLLNYYADKQGQLEEINTSIAQKPKVYLAGNSSMLSTATKKMYQNHLIESAAGINVAGDIEDTYWANVSYEQLIQYNPDYIIIVPESVYKKEDVLNDGNLKNISAVEKNNVFQMPREFEAWDSPVPSGILGKLWLLSILHGDRYSYDEFTDDAYDFYKEFYDFEIDKETLRGYQD